MDSAFFELLNNILQKLCKSSTLNDSFDSHIIMMRARCVVQQFFEVSEQELKMFHWFV